MDAFQLLKEDHRKVEQLFSELESATGKAKLDVFKQIKTELELHTHIEEKIFYPALEEPEETHDLALEAYEEHAVVKTLLKELGRARTANDEWEAQAKVLQENVEHHVEEEENELFKKADSALSEEELEDLTERMIAEKSRKAGRPAVKASARKSSGSRSAAAKTARRSRSKKSAAKKR
jgi:hemerythrin-like domain-containing protein